MNWWVETGRFLIVAGIVVIAVGLVFLLGDKLPLGRLPGDIRLGGARFQLHIPIVTCILLSIIITVLLNFFSRK